MTRDGEKLISVVIPAYNSAQFITETVQSALAQQVAGWRVEAVVTDDGSSDDTAQRAEAAGAKVVRKPNGGISSARNAGLCLASGSLLLLLDGDDRLRPGALNALYGALSQAEDIGAAFGMARDFISPELPQEEKAKLLPRPEPYYGLLTGCMLIRRETLELVGPFDETRLTGEAVEWLTRMIDLGVKTIRTGFECADRRLHLHNTGRLQRRREKEDYAAVLRKRIQAKKKHKK